MKSSCILSGIWFPKNPPLSTTILIIQLSIYPTPQIKIHNQAILKGKKERKKRGEKDNPPSPRSRATMFLLSSNGPYID